MNKPDRRSYLKALDFASARPEECVLIEDSLVNITAARALGITTVMVGGSPESNGADYHIERITDLEDIAGIWIADRGLKRFGVAHSISQSANTKFRNRKVFAEFRRRIRSKE